MNEQAVTLPLALKEDGTVVLWTAGGAGNRPALIFARPIGGGDYATLFVRID